MRFSPYKGTPYDDYNDEEHEFSPFVSSPLKSMLESTPSKKVNRYLHEQHTPNSGFKNGKYISVFHNTPSKENKEVDTQQEKTDLNALSDLLSDLDIKERLGLITVNNASKRNSINFMIKVKADNEVMNPRYDASVASEESETDDEVILRELESSIIDAFESRIDERSKKAQETVDFIKKEKERIEKERVERVEREKREAEARRTALEQQKKKEEEEKEKQRLEQEEQERIRIEKEIKLKQDLAKRKAEEEAKNAQLKQEEEKKKQEASKKKTKGITNFEHISTKFHSYKTKITNIKDTVINPINQDKELKKTIQQHKRKINPKFGQLTNSLSKLSKITNELIELINLTKPEPLAFQWTLNFVSKAIVSQAETEVRAKPSSSVPLAKLVLNLLCEFPEMKEFLLARFIKKCPYIIGHTIHLTNDDSTFVEMAWRRHDEKTWETQISYDERMSGIVTLFFVITRLPIGQAFYHTHKHPLPLSNSWIFIARMLNTPKEYLTSTHYTIVTAWWEACGQHILLNYGTQGVKILQTASRDWCDLVKDKKSDYPGANMLKTKGDDWEREGVIKSFPEMEP